LAIQQYHYTRGCIADGLHGTWNRPAVRGGVSRKDIEHGRGLVYTYQGFDIWRNIAMGQSQVRRARCQIAVGNGLEFTPRGLEQGLADALDHGFMFATILEQVGDGTDLEAVLTRENHEVRQSSHGAVRFEDFADYRR